MSLHLPDVPRALLVTQSNDPENHPILKKMLLAPLLKFHCLHLDKNMVTEDVMRMWQKRGIPVAVWTVNGKEEIQKFLRMGAISVITDTV
jgi:glycerophosphoryl diester phosphodiesterase